MNIQLHATSTRAASTASQSLQNLARDWGYPATCTPARPDTGPAGHDTGKTIDPVAVTSLIVSIPSAALAVLDLADRIAKRRRATQLIDHAQHLTAQHITLTLTIPARTIELATLTPDQLLDLITNGNPPS